MQQSAVTQEDYDRLMLARNAVKSIATDIYERVGLGDALTKVPADVKREMFAKWEGIVFDALQAERSGSGKDDSQVESASARGGGSGVAGID